MTECQESALALLYIEQSVICGIDYLFIPLLQTNKKKKKRTHFIDLEGKLCTGPLKGYFTKQYFKSFFHIIIIHNGPCFTIQVIKFPYHLGS